MIKNTWLWFRICERIQYLERKASRRFRKGKSIGGIKKKIQRLKRWRAIW